MTFRPFLGLAGVIAVAGFFAAPAQAVCTLAGTTVTCSDNDDNGFRGGNDLVVSIPAGAFVQSVYDGSPDTLCPEFRAAISVGRNARITNGGRLLGRGNCGLGLEAGTGLILTNDGDIATDSEVAFAILALDGFDVTNRGTIRTVNSGSGAFVGAGGGRLSITATGAVTTNGSDSPALFVEDANTLINAGRLVTASSGSHGIDAGARNAITNTGTITVSGIAADGIRLRGAGNTVLNSGTITALPSTTPRDGEDTRGVAAEAGNTAITNSGTIAGDYAGVVLGGATNLLENSGTITALAPRAASVPGAAVLVDDSTRIVNQGIIRGIGTAAIRVRGAGLDLTNTGQIAGDVILGGGANVVTLGNNSVLTGAIDGRNGTNRLALVGAGTLSAAILGRFDVDKSAAGTWTLDRNADFGGAITVRDGTLALVNGQRLQGLSLLIDVLGEFAGTGVVSGATSGSGFSPIRVTNAGRLSPGAAAAGDLTIVGSMTQARTGRIVFNLAGAGAVDRLSVAGNVALDGELAVTYSTLSPIRDGQTFTLISVPAGTGTVSGAFSTVTDTAPTFLQPVISVTANAVTARIARTAYATAAQSPETLGIAQAFDRAVAAGGNPLGAVGRLDSLTAPEAEAVFAGLTSDSPASAQTWGLYAGESVVTRMMSVTSLEAENAGQGTWRSWGDGLIRTGGSGLRAGADGFSYDIQGAVAGLDYALADSTRAGMVLAYADGQTRQRLGRGRNDLRATTVGAYVARSWAAWHASGGASLSDGRIRASRPNGSIDPLAMIAGPSSAAADTDGYSAFLDAGYTSVAGNWRINPAVSLVYVHVRTGALDEAVAGGLATQAENAGSVRAQAGARAETEQGPLYLSVGAFWSENLVDNDRTARASIIGLPDSAFVIRGRAEKRGLLNMQAAARYDLGPGLALRVAWSGIVNDRLGGHLASAGLSYRW